MKMKMKKSRIILIIAVVLGIISWISFPLEVSQVEFRLELNAGASSTYSFLVRNDEAIVDQVKVYVGDWDRDINGVHRFYEPGTLPRSLASWITVSPREFELKPNEIQEVRFTINVPAGIEGTYWGGFLVAGQRAFKIRELNLRPIGDSQNPPRDLNGDGLYEDVNGDGQLTMEDASLLEANIEAPEIQENWWAFDFDNDGDADVADVELLKKIIAEQQKS